MKQHPPERPSISLGAVVFLIVVLLLDWHCFSSRSGYVENVAAITGTVLAAMWILGQLIMAITATGNYLANTRPARNVSNALDSVGSRLDSATAPYQKWIVPSLVAVSLLAIAVGIGEPLLTRTTLSGEYYQATDFADGQGVWEFVWDFRSNGDVKRKGVLASNGTATKTNNDAGTYKGKGKTITAKLNGFPNAFVFTIDQNGDLILDGARVKKQ